MARDVLAAPFGHPFLADPFNPMLLAPFAFGMLVAIWGKYVPVSDVAGRRSASRGALVTYDHGRLERRRPVRPSSTS